MKNSEIGEVLKDGLTYRSNSFVLRVLPVVPAKNGGKNTKNKPAFVAGKKIFKTAVLRNKARRKLKAVVQTFKKIAINKKRLVFVINNEVSITKTKDLKDEIENVFSKSGMLSN